MTNTAATNPFVAAFLYKKYLTFSKMYDKFSAGIGLCELNILNPNPAKGRCPMAGTNGRHGSASTLPAQGKKADDAKPEIGIMAEVNSLAIIDMCIADINYEIKNSLNESMKKAWLKALEHANGIKDRLEDNDSDHDENMRQIDELPTLIERLKQEIDSRKTEPKTTSHEVVAKVTDEAGKYKTGSDGHSIEKHTTSEPHVVVMPPARAEEPPKVISKTRLLETTPDAVSEPLPHSTALDIKREPIFSRLFNEMRKEEHQPKIGLGFIFVIGFMIKVLSSAASGSGGSSSGSIIFPALLSWILPLVAGISGLITAHIIKRKRLQYTRKKILLLIPASIGILGFAVGQFVLDSLLIKVLSMVTFAFVGGFWIPGFIELARTKLSIKIPQNKVPKKYLLWGILTVFILAGVSYLTYFLVQNGIKVPFVERKALLLSFCAILLFALGTLYAMSKQSWKTFLLSVLGTGAISTLLYFALYTFDWSNFWSNEMAIAIGVAVVGAMFIGSMIWFSMKSNAKAEDTTESGLNESVKKLGLVRKTSQVIGYALVLAAGFGLAHYLTVSEPIAAKEAPPLIVLGTRNIELKPGMSRVETVPPGGYIIRYKVISEGEALAILNNTPPEVKIRKGFGGTKWDSGIESVEFQNSPTATETVIIEWTMEGPPTSK